MFSVHFAASIQTHTGNNTPPQSLFRRHLTVPFSSFVHSIVFKVKRAGVQDRFSLMSIQASTAVGIGTMTFWPAVNFLS